MFLEQIRNRRTVRKYLDKPIETEKMDKIVEALLRSPSSRSLYPWEFVVVTDHELIQKLAKSKPHGSAFVKGATAVVVIFADKDTADTWIEDCSIATLYAQLTAESLGLGSCWVQLRARPHDDNQMSEAYVAQLLGIPSNLKILSMVAMGYPDEQSAPHTKDELQYKKAKLNHYSKLYAEG